MLLKKFIYPLLELRLRFTLWLFFKKIWVQGNRRRTDPVIYAVNHQNSFLDALVVTATCDPSPYYLARGDVFTSSIVQRLLRFINIMPIYRSKDGMANVRRNRLIIDNCVVLLEAGQSVLIFPEAHHKYQHRVRPIQKGVSRIWQAASEKGLNIPIVPVAIQYENYFQPGYPVVVTYGEPILPSKGESMEEICDRIATGLKQHLVHIENEPYTQYYQDWQKRRSRLRDKFEQLRHDQQVVHQPDNYPVQERNNINWILPFRILAGLTTFLPYLISQLLIRNLKDDQFIASIKVAVWFFMVPEIILVQGVIIGFFISWSIAIPYMVLSLLCGLITLKMNPS